MRTDAANEAGLPGLAEFDIERTPSGSAPFGAAGLDVFEQPTFGEASLEPFDENSLPIDDVGDFGFFATGEGGEPIGPGGADDRFSPSGPPPVDAWTTDVLSSAANPGPFGPGLASAPAITPLATDIQPGLIASREEGLPNAAPDRKTIADEAIGRISGGRITDIESFAHYQGETAEEWGSRLNAELGARGGNTGDDWRTLLSEQGLENYTRGYSEFNYGIAPVGSDQQVAGAADDSRFEIAEAAGDIGLFAGGFVPYVGEALDLHTLFSPDSSLLDRGVALGSLGINALTAGFAPNFGGVVSRNADEFTSVLRGGSDALPSGQVSGGITSQGGGDVVSGTPDASELTSTSSYDFENSAFDDSLEATEAALNLGINLDEVLIVDGVAYANIEIAWTLEPKDIRKVKEAMRAGGASSARIETGAVVTPALSDFLEDRVADGRAFYGGTVQRSSSPNPDYPAYTINFDLR